MECMPIINQKGGVGKTATSVNLGAALAQRGKRVLLIDLDPQAHLTTHLGLDGKAQGAGIYEVLSKGLPLESAIHAYSPLISVVPAHIDLAAAETELITAVGREVILRDLLASRSRPFDIVVIDCPPSLGILTLNALSAATQTLIPLQPHFLSLQGAGKLFETIALVAQRINPKLRVAGLVVCMYEPGTRLSGEVIEDLSSFLEAARGTPVPWRDARLLKTRIRRNVKLAECPSYGQTILEYEPRCNGALDYLALAAEVSEMIWKEPADAGVSAHSSDDETTASESVASQSDGGETSASEDAAAKSKYRETSEGRGAAAESSNSKTPTGKVADTRSDGREAPAGGHPARRRSSDETPTGEADLGQTDSPYGSVLEGDGSPAKAISVSALREKAGNELSASSSSANGRSSRRLRSASC